MIKKLEKMWTIILFINGFSRPNASPQDTSELEPEDMNTDQGQSAVRLIPFCLTPCPPHTHPAGSRSTPRQANQRACKNLTWCVALAAKLELIFGILARFFKLLAVKKFPGGGQTAQAVTNVVSSAQVRWWYLKGRRGHACGPAWGISESCAVPLSAPLLSFYC